MTAPVPSSPRRHVVISALGTTQILAWGSSYYLPAVLAPPIAADMGWTLASTVAGLSCGLIVAGLASPMVGKLIQTFGGRPVLASSSALLAGALALMASAGSYPVFLLSWIVMGVGMAGGLYDAGFATLGRLYGRDARSAITSLTLFGGFASTVCWPLTAFLAENYGWRGACIGYAAIHLLLALPLHLLAVPARPVRDAAAAAGAPAQIAADRLPQSRHVFLLLATILTLASTIASMLSVHLLTVLQLRGMDLAIAVGLGALIGPSQVGARICEALIGRNRQHPIWTMIASTLLMAAGVGLLLTDLPVTALALILYGAGNGIHTIARGALPLVLFDPEAYASIMGRLATPSLIAQAAAPSVGAVLLGYGPATMLVVLLAIALANVGCVAALARSSLRPRALGVEPTHGSG